MFQFRFNREQIEIMSTHKIVSSTKKEFENIEFTFEPECVTIGTVVNVLGSDFKITQNGKIFVLVSKEWNLTLLELEK